MPRTCFNRFPSIAIATLAAAQALAVQPVNAQTVNATIQLPTFRVTQFNSSFSVPDGGTINLGSVGDSRSSLGRRSGGGRGAYVSPRILSNRDLERQLLSPTPSAGNVAALPGPGGSRSAADGTLTHQQLNGQPAVQAKADFLSKHINRQR